MERGKQIFENYRKRQSVFERDLYESIIRKLEGNAEFLKLLCKYNVGGEEAYAVDMYRQINYKLNIIRLVNTFVRLKLYKRKNLRIFEIGPGAGFFQYICREFGHEVISLEIDEDRANPLFKEVTDALGLNVVYDTVRRYKNLPIEGRFDVVVSLTCHFFQHEEGDFWGINEWSFFMKDLYEHIKEDFLIYFELNALRKLEDFNPEKKEGVLGLFNNLGAKWVNLHYNDNRLLAYKFYFDDIEFFDNMYKIK